MPSSSTTILTQTTHPDGSTPTNVYGDAYKGDGYYGRADGLHTVQYNVAGFSGIITIQGTLATDPSNDDWFTVATYNATSQTTSKHSNFTGNFVWIRARVYYTKGTVNSILLNH